MATNLWDPTSAAAHWRQTRVAGQTTFTFNLPATAPAGSTVIITSQGGAQPTFRHTNAAGATAIRDSQGLGTVESSVHRLNLATACSVIHVTLNGAENVGGDVIGVAESLSLIAGSSIGSLAGATANDFQIAPSSAISVTQAALLVGSFAVPNSNPFSGLYQWRQMGPIGRLVDNYGLQPASNGTQYIGATGLADVSATGRYPAHLSAGQYKATSVWIGGGSAACASAAYVDASGVATVAPYANPIERENSLPGCIRTNWFLGNAGTNAGICGYTGKTSYLPGDVVDFKIYSNGQAARVEIYRDGYYGWETFAARNVLGNQAGYLTVTPTTQPAPTVDSATGAVSCAWTTNATWTIPADACPGVYTALLRRQDAGNTGMVSTLTFVVRSASVTGRNVVVYPHITDAAYNVWGATGDNGTLAAGTWSGRSLYTGGGAAATYTQRAAAVSLDRPTSIPTTQTNQWQFDSIHGWIALAEAQGIDLTYLSDIDLELGQSLTAAATVVLLGHHEYISTAIYDALQAAVNAGRNLLVLGSNIALWRVRFDPSDTAKRTIICYKDSGVPDAGASVAATAYDPGGWTGTWRDTRSLNGGAKTNPDVRRENALFGQLFRISAPLGAKLTVPFASKGLPLYRSAAGVQALTSGQTWTSTHNVIGDEGEIPDGSTGQPANQVNLSPTTVTSTTGANAQGTLYSTSVTLTAGWTLHRVTSGALVLATGSWRAMWGATLWGGAGYASPITSIDTTLQQMLLNVMHDLGLQRATAIRAMKPATDPDPVDPAIGAPGPSRDQIAAAYGLTVPAGLGAGFFAAA